MSFTTDGTGNTCQWFKNGEAIDGETSTQITIANSEEGIFYCEVYNVNYPDLILSTNPINKLYRN